jgi:transposase
MGETSRKKPSSPEERKDEKDQRIQQLEERIKELENENEHLKEKTKVLEEEIKHLKKPKWAKPNLNKSKNKKQRKKLGPKVGHSPNPRKPIEQKPDQEVMWVPELCEEGNGPLPFPSKWHEHVQIDIPVQNKIIVTKHTVGWSWCSGCKKYHSAVHEKLSYSKYGPNLHAYVSYLKFDLGMTLGKIQRLISDRYDLNISTGVLSEMINRTASHFKPEYERNKSNLKRTSHLHADETGWRNGGNNEWLWSFSNENVSVFVIVPSRAQKVVKDVLGDEYGGTLVSDFYGGYNRISCKKQRCWTHLLRELHVLKEKNPKDREVIYFALRLKRFFERANRLKEDYKNGIDIESQIKRLETNTINFLTKDFKHKKLITLLKRMTKHYFELYTFIKTNVPATNNPAEREIRPAVLMRKTSYCNRSDQGKVNQAILMSIIATAKKQQRHFMAYASNKLKFQNLTEFR